MTFVKPGQSNSDDLWLPFRSVRCTKSEEAKGWISSLAENCMQQDCDDMYINDEIKRLRLKLNREKVYMYGCKPYRSQNP